jgi:hypothetical protein
MDGPALVSPLDQIADQLDAWAGQHGDDMILEPTKLDDLKSIAGLWGR